MPQRVRGSSQSLNKPILVRIRRWVVCMLISLDQSKRGLQAGSGRLLFRDDFAGYYMWTPFLSEKSEAANALEAFSLVPVAVDL